MLSCLHVSVCSQTQFSIHTWDEIFTVAHRIVWLTEWKSAEVQGPLCLEVRCGLMCWNSCHMYWHHCSLWPSEVRLLYHFGWEAARRNVQFTVGTVWILKKYIHEFNYRVSHLLFSQAQQLSQDVLVDAGFLCDKAAMLRETIKETLCRWCN
jgi:hypothetical protein